MATKPGHPPHGSFDREPDWRAYVELVEIDGKGRGFRAVCDISSMTCFMHDTPLISPSFPASAFPKHKACFPSKIMMPLIVQLLENQELFDLLSPQIPASRFAMERSPLPDLYSDEKWRLAHDKVSTNMFNGSSPDSNMFEERAVLKLATKTCFFNHSCRSNAIVHAIRGTIKQQVEAVRDITKGEEVCISYLDDGYLPREERQRLLLERGFECHCERCSMEPVFERDIPLTSDVDLSPLCSEQVAPLRDRYDQLAADLQSMLGRGNPRSSSLWITRAEQWLVNAWKPPYRLHPHYWLVVHVYKMLRDRYKTMYVSHVGDRNAMRKKALFYGKQVVRAEGAVLQPLDPDKQGIDALFDDWNDMDIPKDNVWKVLQDLEPNAQIIIKRING